jgi:hypothetical protein
VDRTHVTDDETGMRIGGGRRRRVTIAAVVAGLVLLPALGAVAGVVVASDFDDVAAGSTHDPGITWLAGAGVTAGCNPAGTLYCPTDPVTRAQMATFMYRLSGNAPGIAPSVDAASVGGFDAGDLLDGPVAHARVQGTSLPINSGFAGVSRPTTGVYCLSLDPALGLGPDDVHAQVTVDWIGSTGNDLFAHYVRNSFGCSAGEFGVRTYRFDIEGGNVVGTEASNQVNFIISVYAN